MASILQSLAAESCLRVHLAFLELKESGRAEGSSDYGWELDETDYYNLSATGWMDLDGSPVNPMDVEEEHIIQVSAQI